jgi:pimeloyl-ACP methyl ester carboxylesterase
MLTIVLSGILVLFGMAAVRVDRATRPPRQLSQEIDFGAVLLKMEEVGFDATDRVGLEGWLFPGSPDRASIVLAHDLGSNRSSLLHLAVSLRKLGFTVLVFDARGHGESEGKRSTFGILEKRDVLGAIDHLAERATSDSAKRIGIYGVGMGAHAAVLAARERPAVKVLVLDALYPDAGYPLVRNVYGDWSFGSETLGFIPRGIFSVLNSVRIERARAEDELALLLGRDVLLVGSDADVELSVEMKRMVRKIPDQPDVDGNLVLLPATQRDGLYGEDLASYQEQVTDFFAHRLGGILPVVEEP